MGKQCFSLFRAFLVLLSFASTALLFPKLYAAAPAHAPKQAQAKSFSAPELAKESNERIRRIPEFAFIREEAERLGVKVYLFGGTAASYAHYVKEDLLRERGDTRYPADRFDYDYTNIFRSTQDLDIVIDGTGDQAAALEQTLKRKFPHFVGDKSAQWEVRALRDTRADKEPILDNPSFANQHTDSHSTGLVEITKTTAGESPVRDVRDWEAKEPTFLRDVTQGEIHYYFSDLHHTTNRAQKGLNPPILSAIRYLTKAFQYDLKIPPADLAKVREVVAAFDPKVPLDPYVAKWIEKNAKKLFLHSVDLENSWNQLEELGLRNKLIALKNDPGTKDTLAWWMSKEPLRTQAVGQGSGKTAAEIARELKLDKISLAHETNSFLAYESITRSRAGELNGLISRAGAVGELAAHGDGFYAALGRKGARNTGLTIRMELDPKAREGADFDRAGNYFVLKNRGAVRVIPESIQLSLLEYFKQLGEGKEFSSDDRALLEAFRRKTKTSLTMDPAEKKELFEYVQQAIELPKESQEALLGEWFKQPMSAERPDLLDEAIKATEKKFSTRAAIFRALRIPHWRDQPHTIEVVAAELENARPRLLPELLTMIAEMPALKNHPDFFSWAKLAAGPPVDEKLTREALNSLVPALYEKGRMEEFLEHVFRVGPEANFIRQYAVAEILAKPEAAKLKNLEAMVDTALADNPSQAARQLLIQPHVYDHPRFEEWLNRLGDAEFVKKYGFGLASEVIRGLPFKMVKEPEVWAERIAASASGDFGPIRNLILGHPFFRFHPKASGWIDMQLKAEHINSFQTFEFLQKLAPILPREAITEKYIKYFQASKVGYSISPSQLLLPELGLNSRDYPLIEAYLDYARRVGGYNLEPFVDRITRSFLAGDLPAEKFDRWMEEIVNERDGNGIRAAVSDAFHWIKVQERPHFGRWMEKAIENYHVHEKLLTKVLTYPPVEPARNRAYWAWMKKLASNQRTDFGGDALLLCLMQINEASEHPEVVEALIANKRYYYHHLSNLFEQPGWRNQPGFQRMLGLKSHEPVKALAVKDAIEEGRRLSPVNEFVLAVKRRCSSWFGAIGGRK